MTEPIPQDNKAAEVKRKNYLEMLASTEPYILNPNAIAESDQRFADQETLPAFNETVIGSPYNTSDEQKIYEFTEQAKKNYIIRAIDIETLHSEIDDMSQIERYDFLNKEGEELAGYFRTLKKYGITVAPTFFVVGREEQIDQQNMRLFVCTTKVQGSKLIHSREFADDNEKNEFHRELIDTFCNLCNYLVNELKEGREILNDIFAIRQYRYGNVEGIEGNKLYLVDTDCGFDHLSSLDKYSDFIVNRSMWGLEDYYITLQSMDIKPELMEKAKKSYQEALRYLASLDVFSAMNKDEIQISLASIADPPNDISA